MDKPHKDKDYHEIKKDIELKEKAGTQRGPDGKFLPGCAGGPGAKSLHKDKIRYHDILRKCVTDEDFSKVAMKLLERAQAGEPWAIAQLLDRLLGKPKNMVDVDLKTTHTDPKMVVNNVAILLGITEEGDEYIGIDKKEVEQIEDKGV